MFEIIETRQIFNLTCYKVKTSDSVDWYYFKGKEIKDIRYFDGLKYCKRFKCMSITPVVTLDINDWADAKKFVNSLN